jgi:hypothetical protein
MTMPTEAEAIAFNVAALAILLAAGGTPTEADQVLAHLDDQPIAPTLAGIHTQITDAIAHVRSVAAR